MQQKATILKNNFCKLSFILLMVSIGFTSCKKNETAPTPVTPPPPVATDVTVNAIAPASGPKNTAVTITGTNFSTTLTENVVTINDLPCPVTAATATELKITIPDKAGSGKIKVTVKGKAAETALFTYNSALIISTLAGANGEFTGHTDLNSLTVDILGNIYVHTNDGIIYKITSSGVTTQFSGGANVTPGNLGITFDKDNNLFYASGDGRVQKRSPGKEPNNYAINGEFTNPKGISIDKNGNVFLADETTNKIYTVVNGSGVISTFAGANAEFDKPQGVVVDKAGNVYVANLGSGNIKKISAAGVTAAAPFAQGLNQPIGLAIDKDDNIYVVETGTKLIKKITPAGVVTTFAGANNEFGNPYSVAIDKDGNVFVVDKSNSTVKKIVSE